MMRDDMALPAVLRDALIERTRLAMVNSAGATYGLSPVTPETDVGAYRTQADAALAAIEEQYILIPKDQMTVEAMGVYAEGGYFEGLRLQDAESDAAHISHTRLRTDWKEHDDPTG